MNWKVSALILTLAATLTACGSDVDNKKFVPNASFNNSTTNPDAGGDGGVDGGTNNTGGPNCGNGVLDDGEECDDGNRINTDSCLDTCVAARCGDGIQGPGEGCDDGNSDDTDGCTSACVAATCGDGQIQGGEQCDDGNMSNTDSCLNSCVAATCGDSFVGPGEDCDDGNNDPTDACVSCSFPYCGDGIVNGDEVCDDGNFNENDGCTSTCDGWAYQRTIDITNATPRSGYQVLVVLDRQSVDFSAFGAGGRDIRFDSDGDPSNGFDLSHWVEAWNDNNKSYIWVRMPTLPVGTTRIYMHYGFTETAADVSSFDTVFPNARTLSSTGLHSDVTADAVVVEFGSVVTMPQVIGAVRSIDARYVRITGRIEGIGSGHGGGGIGGPGEGPGGGEACPDSTGSRAGGGGGAYGGDGGRGGYDSGDLIAYGGVAYGSETIPVIEPGSGGGGCDVRGGDGGAALHIAAERINIEGTIDVSGTTGAADIVGGGGGSGGGILLEGESVHINGILRADGGVGGSPATVQGDGGGGGGGGRIKIFHGNDFVSNAATMQARGGARGSYGGVSAEAGEDGTIFETSGSGLDVPSVSVGNQIQN